MPATMDLEIQQIKTLIDDGAMNTVVRDWNITLATQKQSSSLSQAICNSIG